MLEKRNIDAIFIHKKYSSLLAGKSLVYQVSNINKMAVNHAFAYFIFTSINQDNNIRFDSVLIPTYAGMFIG